MLRASVPDSSDVHFQFFNHPIFSQNKTSQAQSLIQFHKTRIIPKE
jgi:hypothetical protein